LRLAVRGDPGSAGETLKIRKLEVLTFLAVFGVVLAAVLVVASWGDSEPATTAALEPKSAVCPPAERASWQKLANEIDAAVYCPTWLPDPLEGRFGGPFFNGRSVDPDRSYLVSFVWFETGNGVANEVHVNLRGYPGRTRVPTCEDTLTVDGETVHKRTPCFSDPQGQRRIGPTTVTVYTANQGADTWHVLYAWRRNSSLYTLSEHVAEPYTYREVISHLNRMMRTLVLVQPQA
jgi:hypothetical protein